MIYFVTDFFFFIKYFFSLLQQNEYDFFKQKNNAEFY